jgi:hypothetical protein
VNPLVTFADPERALRTYLTTEWAARAEAYKPATLSNAFPTTTLSGNATHVQVELDGSEDEYPITERATVRVTFYSAPTSQDNAKNGAAVTRALCLTHPGDADIAGVSSLTGRLKAVDPDTGNNMVSFTVRVSLLAHLLAA